ncbi:PAS domain-containing sensor histidine kinase [Thermodesulfobacteriota bacterium]
MKGSDCAMKSSEKTSRSETKPFRLAKFFALASFIVLIIFSFPLSVIISQEAKEILLKSYENYALLLGQNLNHQVFQNFSVPESPYYGRNKLSDPEQREMMDRVVRNTIHAFNVERVNILVIHQVPNVIAYSTNPKMIGLEVKETEGYKSAVKGELSSGVISSGYELRGLGIEIVGGEKKLRTYIPYKMVHPYTGKVFVGGVFELIQDFTKQYESILQFQYLIFGLSILIMGLIFLVLLLIVRKAESLIDQRAKEQRELEEQLHLAERLAALGEMVAGVSHEIKNPLGIIQSTAELLGALPDADDNQKRLSGVIEEESSRLNKIVTEFLDFARPQVPKLGECHLDDILLKNISFLKPELDKQGIRITDNLDGRSFKLTGDQEQLYRAFLNIFMNAAQSIKEDGSIDIRVREEKGFYITEIADTGGGISSENMMKIFNPFFTTKETGSGLGLPIVKKIIEGHEGRIGLESQKERGTKVKVELPRKIN